MDKPALFALATANLVQSLDQTFEHENIDEQTGATHPEDIAASILRLWERHDDLKLLDNPIHLFDWGFAFGLQLGCAVAEQPGRIHDVGAITKPILIAIENAIFEEHRKRRERNAA